MITNKKLWFVYASLLLVAFSFRLFIALRLPNDNPDDGRVYARLALNILERHVYSHDSEPPYNPSLIRLPGYPLFLASAYSIAGHGNNKAVRLVQATIDTATCGLIALIAFQWMPYARRKHAASIAALTLGAVCPFTAIYVATILTEVMTNFLLVAMVLLATYAFKAVNNRKRILFWFATGIVSGTAVFFRPDSGLFAAAIGLMIICPISFSLSRSGETESVEGNDKLKLIGHSRDKLKLIGHSRDKLKLIGQKIPQAAVFSLAFCLVLVPWTIRNYRVFHVFQPLSPAHGEMPGEFVPRGYLMWLRTWLDDGRYILPVLWNLDSTRITINKFPTSAFDSPAERDRVATLLEKYNYPSGAPTPQPSPTPKAQSDEQSENEDEDEDSEDNEKSEEEPNADVEMTPEIDAAFGQIARERIARAPIRYYVWLPMKRAKSLWFDTHSQYYPFEGDLLPLDELDYSIHQHIWLPLFAGITAVFTLLGIIGAVSLLLTRDRAAWRWLMFAALLIFLRIGFFSSLENPEPRYVVEIFPLLAILGGIAIGSAFKGAQRLSGNQLFESAGDYRT